MKQTDLIKEFALPADTVCELTDGSRFVVQHDPEEGTVMGWSPNNPGDPRDLWSEIEVQKNDIARVLEFPPAFIEGLHAGAMLLDRMVGQILRSDMDDLIRATAADLNANLSGRIQDVLPRAASRQGGAA